MLDVIAAHCPPPEVEPEPPDKNDLIDLTSQMHYAPASNSHGTTPSSCHLLDMDLSEYMDFLYTTCSPLQDNILNVPISCVTMTTTMWSSAVSLGHEIIPHRSAMHAP